MHLIFLQYIDILTILLYRLKTKRLLLLLLYWCSVLKTMYVQRSIHHDINKEFVSMFHSKDHLVSSVKICNYFQIWLLWNKWLFCSWWLSSQLKQNKGGKDVLVRRETCQSERPIKKAELGISISILFTVKCLYNLISNDVSRLMVGCLRFSWRMHPNWMDKAGYDQFVEESES